MYTHMYWERTEETPFYFQLSLHQSVGLSARWYHGVRRRGLVRGSCLEGRKSLWEFVLAQREFRIKVVFVLPRLNVLVTAGVKWHGVKCIIILICNCNFYPLYCRVLSAGTTTLSHFLSADTIYNNVFAYSERSSVSASTDHPHSFPWMSLPQLSNKTRANYCFEFLLVASKILLRMLWSTEITGFPDGRFSTKKN